MSDTERCSSCTDIIDYNLDVVRLELSQTTGLYTIDKLGEEDSQGYFPFCKTCAINELSYLKSESIDNMRDVFGKPTKEVRATMGGIINYFPTGSCISETSFGYTVESNCETVYIHYDKETNRVVSSVLFSSNYWAV